MQQLINLLGQAHPLHKQFGSELQQIMIKKTLKKNDILQFPDQLIPSMYFIESGLLKGYRFEEEKEICTWFQNEGNVVMSLNSWYGNLPTDEYIEALEDSVVYSITKEELNRLYEKYPEFNKNGRLLTEQYYLLIWRWLDLIRTKQAHERYAFFIENFGEWVKRVPSKDIASFLGISKSHFSHSKRKLT